MERLRFQAIKFGATVQPLGDVSELLRRLTGLRYSHADAEVNTTSRLEFGFRFTYIATNSTENIHPTKWQIMSQRK